MDPTILTVIIASSAFILSIFAANWLNLRSNEKLFERLDKQLAAQFGEVRTEIGAVRTEMTARFEAMENKIAALRVEMTMRFEALENKIAALRAEMTMRFEALEDKVDRLDRQMEAIFKPVLPKP